MARWALENIASGTRAMGAQPVYAIIPMPKAKGNVPPRAVETLLSIAADAGFLVINMQDVYDGHDPDLLTLNGADNHPNAEGHRIIAERLYTELAGLPGVLAADGANVAAPGQAVEGWKIETREGSAATLESSRKDQWLRVAIAQIPQRVQSHVRLRQAPVPITQLHDYVLSFWMKADAPRPVGCGVAQGGESGELRGEYTTLKATTSWQEFKCRFKATATDPSALLLFDLGMSNVAVDFSNLVLRDLSTGSVVVTTDPSWRPPAPKVR